MIYKRMEIIAKTCILKSAHSYLSHQFISRFSTVPAPSYLHHIGKKPLVYRNVGQELEHTVAAFGNAEAIVSVEEQKRFTYKTLLGEVDRLAAGFVKLGLQRGDHVGIWAPNQIHWYLTMLGAARAGLCSVGINPAFQGPEIEYCLQKVNIKAIVASESFKTQNYYEILHDICPELSGSEKGKIKSIKFPHLKSVIIATDSKLKGAFTFNEVLGLSNDTAAISRLQKEISPDMPCNIQFTSGTTGKPKAAVLSHNNFVNNGIHVGNRNEYEGQRICIQVPLFHVFGAVISIMASMSKGATLILPAAGFSPEASLRAIIAEQCTVIHGTPTMYVDLIRKQRELQLPVKTAQLAVSGGAPISPQLIRDIKETLGVKRMHSVYGLTETTAVIFQSCPGDSEERVLNTVGHLQDHVEAKVIDEQGNAVPFGQRGELCVRGYVSSLGYYGDEAKTKEMIGNEGWLKTGDQFILQEDGYGRIVGRLKEMIIRGGENIFPKEIEDFLNTHPDITESHVVGVPDERLGEEVCAFVLLDQNTKPNSITRESLKEYSKRKIAHYKVPRYVIPIQNFPKTTSGKIQKFKLLEIFKNNHMNE